MLVMLMAASCAQEEVETIVEQQRKLTLTFNMEDSRSRALAEDALNMAENKVDRADVFFFDNSGTYLFHQLGLVPTTPTQANDGSWKMNVNVTVPSGITFNGGTYQVYVLGNAQVASDGLVEKVTNLGKGATIESLQALTFTSALETQISEATRFIMDGVNNVTISAKQEVGGEIPLVRAAAKVGLNLEVFESIEGEDGKTYVPAPNSVKVSYHNGVKTFGITPVEFFKTEQWEGAATSETANNGVYQVAIDPFYSYPLSWDEESDHEPYMMLQMNWGVQSGSDIDYVPYYYRIPVNRKYTNEDGDLALERNNAYLINLEIGVLGSTDPGQVVTLESGYEIMDWGTLPINTEVRDYKYLVVDEHEVSIYGENGISIAFASSHPVTVTIDKIEYKNYRNVTTRDVRLTNEGRQQSVNNGTTWTTYNNNKDTNEYSDYKVGRNNESQLNSGSVALNKDAGTIYFYHEILNNNYTPHEIYITVQHTNDDEYKEEIVITQYPPIYIIGARSNGYVYVNEETDNDGNIYADVSNNYRNLLGTIIDRDQIGAGGSDQNSNTNPNQYTMYVTATENYTIGDPRVALGTEWRYANQFDDDKGLKYYRPTRSDASAVMAPIFKIASSYARTTSITFENAQKRCATYQENGYPAGRWRIPTAAEMEFITGLWGDDAIPSIFNSQYWVADGRQYDYEKNNGFIESNSSTTVRCVYDVWYWGDEQQNNALTSPRWAVESVN